MSIKAYNQRKQKYAVPREQLAVPSLYAPIRIPVNRLTGYKVAPKHIAFYMNQSFISHLPTTFPFYIDELNHFRHRYFKWRTLQGSWYSMGYAFNVTKALL